MRGSERVRCALALAGLAVALCAPALAQSTGTASREQELIRRLRQQVLQLQQENEAATQAAQQAARQRGELEARLKTAESSATTLKASARRVATVQGELAAAQSERDALHQSLQQANGLLEAQRTQLAQARTRLEQQEGELTQLRTAAANRDGVLIALETRQQQQNERLNQCIDHNVALYRLGQQLLDRYRDKAIGESLAQQESVLQLGRVQLENLVQDYRDKLVGERVNPSRMAP
ncbi:MAG TPA: hypothetical protein VML58_14365 [Burkholderiaceae bacterium]|nr:hypothetical protein [Burkholderiaceae bacterium]